MPLQTLSCAGRGVWRGAQTRPQFRGKTQETCDNKCCQISYICKQRIAGRREGLGFQRHMLFRFPSPNCHASDLTVLQRREEIDLAIRKVRRALGAVSAVAGRQAGTRKFIKLFESTEKTNLQKLSG